MKTRTQIAQMNAGQIEISANSQAYFWSEEWQAAEEEASADVAAGRVSEFDTVEDLIAGLEGNEQVIPE